MNWKVNDYPKYAVTIREAERRHHIPENLLGRLLWHCSHYDADRIAGKGVSKHVGALGIAQLLPDARCDRLDPFAAIEECARILRRFRLKYGSWRLALIAYKRGGIDGRVEENRAFIAQVLGC